ncbi:MAG: hypothetical protein JSW45_04595 [Thiotrichales bacterium]|nr:MAG: hypothetical protein JSW45_04595 [Thiotrichales bacterium]
MSIKFTRKIWWFHKRRTTTAQLARLNLHDKLTVDIHDLLMTATELIEQYHKQPDRNR